MSVDSVTGDVNIAFYDTRQRPYRLAVSDRLLSGALERRWRKLETHRTFALAASAQTSMIAMASFRARELTTATAGDYKAWFPMAALLIRVWTDSRRQFWMRPAVVRRPYLMEEEFQRESE